MFLTSSGCCESFPLRKRRIIVLSNVLPLVGILGNIAPVDRSLCFICESHVCWRLLISVGWQLVVDLVEARAGVLFYSELEGRGSLAVSSAH